MTVGHCGDLGDHGGHGDHGSLGKGVASITEAMPGAAAVVVQKEETSQPSPISDPEGQLASFASKLSFGAVRVFDDTRKHSADDKRNSSHGKVKSSRLGEEAFGGEVKVESGSGEAKVERRQSVADTLGFIESSVASGIEGSEERSQNRDGDGGEESQTSPNKQDSNPKMGDEVRVAGERYAEPRTGSSSSKIMDQDDPGDSSVRDLRSADS